MKDNPIYLGDAVYACWDGYGIELKLNSHENKCAVYLEPEVMQNLIDFWKAIEQEVADKSAAKKMNCYANAL
jgi:hypothetical protein